MALCAQPDVARRVLKLSDRQLPYVAHNRAIASAPTMAAVDRYTGVLFDALDAPSLDSDARGWLGKHAWIHSALLGPVAGLDEIPMYRLVAGTAIPGLSPLRRHWADAVTLAIAEVAPPFVLDLRSEAYVALGPVPASVPSAYARVVTDTGGATRALNHFNKKAKGLLVRALAESRPQVQSLDDLVVWAETAGIELRSTADPHVIELVAE